MFSTDLQGYCQFPLKEKTLEAEGVLVIVLFTNTQFALDYFLLLVPFTGRKWQFLLVLGNLSPPLLRTQVELIYAEFSMCWVDPLIQQVAPSLTAYLLNDYSKVLLTTLLQHILGQWFLSLSAQNLFSRKTICLGHTPPGSEVINLQVMSQLEVTSNRM